MAILDTYAYSSSTSTFTETLTDSYGCDEQELYKTNPIVSCTGRITVRGNSGTITYTGQTNPPDSGRCAIYIAKAFGSFMTGAYTQNRYTVQFPFVVEWDSGSSQSGGSTNFDGIVWPYANYVLSVSTNIPVFGSNDLAQAYFNAPTQEAALEALKRAINYKMRPVSSDQYVTTQLNLLRRRLMKLVMDEVDYSKYFDYFIADGCAWVTKVKGDVWYQDFHNRDIYFPNTLEGYPVVLVSQTWN